MTRAACVAVVPSGGQRPGTLIYSPPTHSLVDA
jgi:hypothetical protein